MWLDTVVVVAIVGVAVVVVTVLLLDFDLEQGQECEGDDMDDVREPVYTESD